MRLDFRGRVGSGGGDDHALARPVGQEGSGHLRTARVMPAHEQHPHRATRAWRLGVRERVEALGRQPLGQHHQMRTHPGVLSKQPVGVGQQLLHGLHGEVAPVAGGEARDPGAEPFIRPGGWW